MRPSDLWYRIRALLTPRRMERDLNDEVAFHLEMETEKYRRQGMKEVEARRLAERKFGGVVRQREAAREAWGITFLLDLLADLRRVGRQFGRSPGFAVAAIVTLALGIGATTAIFSIVHRVLLRPLPYDHPTELVVVGHHTTSGNLGVPAAAWFHYSDRAQTLATFAIYVESSASIAGTGEPLVLGLIQATPSLLGVLGVVPTMGRDLTEADALPGAPPVALVSHGYWVRRLGSDPDVLGKPVLQGSAPVVVGVLPPGFEFERPVATVVFGDAFAAPDVIMPLGGLDRSTARFGNFMYQGIARLAPGATKEDARAELSRLMPEAAETYPGLFTPEELAEGGYSPRVIGLKEAIVGDLAEVLWLLFGAIGFLLLIATANVANLFLVRADGRGHELGIRRALGASKASIARTFLTESLVLALVGGLLGVVAAGLGVGAILRLAPAEIPRAGELGLSLPVVGFSLGVAVLTGVLFGLAPLLRPGPTAGSLGERSRGGTLTPRASRGRRVLVVAQVALAVVLLIGAGLLVRSSESLRRVDPGFDGRHTATLKLALSGSLLRAAGRTESAQDASRSRFMLDLAQRFERLPGVERATFAADLPLDGREAHDFIAVEHNLPTGLESATKALRVFVGPGYLEAIGARLSAGRELEAYEFYDQPRSVVVNRAFAESRFPGGDAIGKRLMQFAGVEDPSGDVWYTIVGIVENIHETSLMQPPVPAVYLPTIFLPEGGFAMFVSNMIAVVRVTGDPAAMLPRLQAEVRDAYPEIPINGLATLNQITARSFQRVSFAMTILLLAAGMALVLGMVGTYSTVAYVVAQRRREFGVRKALGATTRDVRRVVFLDGGRMGILGVALGLTTAAIASQVVRSLLFGVSTLDPAVYLLVAGSLVGMVVAASLVPALRAAAADPSEAMRVE